MASRISLRTLGRVVRAPTLSQGAGGRRNLHIKVGDELPDVGSALMENSPGNKVNLAEEVKRAKNALIIGVPAAFSPACSASHVPSYLKHPATKEFAVAAVVSVNDAFVMKAWGQSLDPTGQSGVRFLADPSGSFTKALELDFDSTAIFGNKRSKRYAILVENGRVKSVKVEPDNTGTDVSMADKVLGAPAGVDWNA